MARATARATPGSQLCERRLGYPDPQPVHRPARAALNGTPSGRRSGEHVEHEGGVGDRGGHRRDVVHRPRRG